jgi:hypothetical protein
MPVLLVLGAKALLGQQPVDSKHLNERVLVIVPLVGAGTYQDPKRPLFAPESGEKDDSDGVQSFEWQPTDDGQFAIAEFVARDPKVIADIVADRSVVEAFIKGKAKKDDIEKELKKYRKDFTFEAGSKRP